MMTDKSLYCFWVAFSAVFCPLVQSSVLYLTPHDSPYNVVSFDATTGDLISTKLFDTSDIDWTDETNLHWRGMTIVDSVLFVANSKKGKSFVAKFQCNNDIDWLFKHLSNRDSTIITNNLLPFIGNLTGESETNSGLDHPYGVKYDSLHNDRMYVSTQNTQSLLCYQYSNGQPCAQSNGMSYDYPGAIATYGAYADNSNGVRGVAFDANSGMLFVAEQSFEAILAYDTNNAYRNSYNVTWDNKGRKPVGVIVGSPYYSGIIFIGDIENDRVYAFKVDRNGYELWWKSEKTSHLDHPAGMAISTDSLFVVSQNSQMIVAFNPTDGTYQRTVVDFSKESFDGEALLYVSGYGCAYSN